MVDKTDKRKEMIKRYNKNISDEELEKKLELMENPEEYGKDILKEIENNENMNFLSLFVLNCMDNNLKEKIGKKGYNINIKGYNVEIEQKINLIDQIQSWITLGLAGIGSICFFLLFFNNVIIELKGILLIIAFLTLISCTGLIFGILFKIFDIVINKITKINNSGFLRFKDQRILISTNNSNFENIDSNINSLVDIEINDFDITFKLNERKICFYLISIPDKDCRTYLTNNIFDYLSDVKNKGVIV